MEYIRCENLTPEHAPEVAKLHIEGIRAGFVSSLGIDFVTALYKAIANNKTGFGFTIQEDERILGFIAFTTNINKLYKSVIARKGLRFATLLAREISSLENLKKILHTLSYPKRIKNMALPSAELLSILIIPEMRRQGRGSLLVRKGLERCLELGLKRVKVLVGTENTSANRLYQKCGFELSEQIENHGVKSNIYVVQISKTLMTNYEELIRKHARISSRHVGLYDKDVIRR
ncbi:MAG: GNAT family N-acetyltransferase [Planctomycetota bacterium]|jgi:ribosomal protein S18 acetylase RimI-like enzyme